MFEGGKDRMIHLALGAYHALFDEPEYRVVLIGPSGAGKSSLFSALKQLSKPAVESAPFPLPSSSSSMPSRLPAVQPTVGLNISHNVIEVGFAAKGHKAAKSSSGKQQKYLLWDLGGKKSLRPLWTTYLNECDGIVFVVGATASPEEEEDAERAEWADAANILRFLMLSPSLKQVPILIAANKADDLACQCCHSASNDGVRSVGIKKRKLLSLAEIQDRLRLIDIAMSATAYNSSSGEHKRSNGSSRSDVGASSSGLEEIEVPSSVTMSAGIGAHPFRILYTSAASTPHEVVHSEKAKAKNCSCQCHREMAQGSSFYGIRAGIDWMMGFLQSNKKIVPESL